MNGERDLEVRIEAAASAYRERGRDGRILASPAWHDLAPEERERLFELQFEDLQMARAVDLDGLSPTVRAVLARIEGR